MSNENYTAQQAAEMLGVNASRVRQMVLAGQLPATKFGNVLMISGKAIEAARQRKTTPGRAPAKIAPAKKAARPRARKRASKKGGKK
jgi:excisionase family DNA binding protein